MSEKVSWKDKKEKPNIVNFSDKNILVLDFLDNGKDIYDKPITKKDGSNGVIKHSVEFSVINTDDNKKYMFNASAVRLMVAISNASKKQPKGKMYQIKRVLGKKETDNTYEVIEIKKLESK